jgi:N utilization substance protein A
MKTNSAWLSASADRTSGWPPKLVGWNIDIRSEEELKKEVAEAMGAMIASGAPVPLSAIEGVTSQQAEALAEHNVNDIDGLAATTVDDLVEFLDVSLDEAEKILAAAQSVIQVRERSRQTGEDETAEVRPKAESEIEQHAASAELDENAPATEVAPNDDMTAAGYDEAVERGVPFSAEQNNSGRRFSRPGGSLRSRSDERRRVDFAGSRARSAAGRGDPCPRQFPGS